MHIERHWPIIFRWRNQLTDIREHQLARHGSPDFYKLLEEMAELHDKKSHDYASNDNPVGNYEFAGELSCMFSHSPKDAGFVGRLGEKLYRLSNLEKDKKIPLNESIEDTERDLCVIMVLWMASRRNRRNMNKSTVDDKLTYNEFVDRERILRGK